MDLAIQAVTQRSSGACVDRRALCVVCLRIAPFDIAIMIGMARVYLFTCLSSVDANVAASMTHTRDPHH
ncbi:hypothetical protein [Xanthomonas euroxanthea]|uniref:hypothetical protein n=1 Tax=Xanthomonas euroxanthea TaxID=2259622 RepID=UPI00160DCEE1|nr:hypothetical protein [Xanthomonas euroxanthea]MBB5768963.1 hypothetical protein [Xanthomonas euroxanthea]